MTPDIEVPAKLPLSVNDRPARHYKRVVGIRGDQATRKAWWQLNGIS